MGDQVIDKFRKLLDEHHIVLTEEMLNQFDVYYRELISWNEKMNLTGITDREQVYMKHFYDSATLAFYLDLSGVRTLADIGSGAGFPSIPLKILFPHLQVTIIDSLNKRIQFLNHLIGELGLEQVEAVHARAEESGHSSRYREQYDLVTARAVARMSVLNEFCIPFVKMNGYFAAMKGTNPQEELVEADYSLHVLGAKLEQVYPLRLPVEDSERHIITISKVKPTPKKYPRKPGTPLKQPLLK